MTMKDPDPTTVARIVEAARDILAGHHPANQGAALADLTAIWLAGHPPEVRETFLTLQVNTIRKLIPVNARIMGRRE